jgi:acyl-CoA dehydrogenase
MLDSTPARAVHETDLDSLRKRTRALCAGFPDAYWRETDRDRRYPQEFVDTLTAAGLLSVLIPVEYGGAGLGVTEASVVMEEINRSGGHSAACHAQMYTMGALLRHGSQALKDAYLPHIARGELRLQAFSVTEAAAGSDTTAIATTATRDGDDYVITGHKNWTSRIAESDLALVLARTGHEDADRTRGLTLFLVDLRQVRAEQPDTLEVVPVRTMFNYATNQVHYRGVRVPVDHVWARSTPVSGT